ncbi:hypothetical protein [Paucidesulfovibrio gracilis]|uniref:hypothetical protein n=1 Tax=Paucidesulfovibrio gracilis TaxID=47158 RepID=UPI0009991BAB|nr:hypothetical protein [Paucidesulfovibrio gracilis]
MSESLPCVGCGWCCLHDQCDLSHRLHGYCRRCPEVYWSEELGRYLCALVGHVERDREARRALFVGMGCCYPASPWREDVRNRDEEFPP